MADFAGAPTTEGDSRICHSLPHRYSPVERPASYSGRDCQFPTKIAPHVLKREISTISNMRNFGRTPGTSVSRMQAVGYFVTRPAEVIHKHYRSRHSVLTI